MLRCIRLAVIALVLAPIASAAAAAQPCASRSDVIPLLKSIFGELETGLGLSNKGHVVEIFVSPAGTWTILLSRPDGLSCIVDEGEAWTLIGSPSRDARHLQLHAD
ncbi:hypothetical protein AYJ54_01175 [Bradyrhizobium centrolobii]|uniref:Uncharacterized protein n=1 Tax=Bradyrhizobium centrolobii TaxID=1505087 RepID=A0A176YIP0_9BRAD|nr:hypothetical protein [Bradyrhizobium centrolobii]OAF05546.1 hypothetical protein AYJ54_01175 [Bradyrhizobium centrolobii]